MSEASWSEERLETGCRAGDPEALRVAVSYLDEPQAYTRARAAEMLAEAPESALLPWLDATGWRTRPPSESWSRVVGEFAMAHRRFPGNAELDVDAYARVMGGTDGDVAYQVLQWCWSGALGRADTERLATSLARHADGEVAGEASVLLAPIRPLSSGELQRLREWSETGAWAAVDALARLGDAGARALVVEEARRSGPMRFGALELIGELRMEEALPLLRSRVGRRWFVTTEHAASAVAASAMGEAAGVEALRAYAGNRSEAVRAMAWVGLFRYGSEADVSRARERAMSGAPESAMIVAALWHRPDEASLGVLVRCLEDPATEELALAGLEAASEWPAPKPAVLRASVLALSRGSRWPEVRREATRVCGADAGSSGTDSHAEGRARAEGDA